MKECETAYILLGNGQRIYIQILKITIHVLSAQNATKFTLERRKTFERRENIIRGLLGYAAEHGSLTVFKL